MNRKMKALLTSFVVFFAIILFVIGMPMVNAYPVDQAVSGTYFVSGPPQPPVIKVISSSVQTWEMSAPMTYTGDISGSGINKGHWLVLNPFASNMKVYAVGTTTISATVDGKTGTLIIGGFTMATMARANGNWWIISGTDGLANLHGGGTFRDIDISMGVYAYAGQVYFDH